MPFSNKSTFRGKPRPLHIILMALVPAIAIGGFGLMYLLGHTIPIRDSDVNAGLLMFILIVFGLAVPYAMLKLGVHESAHLRDQPEKDLEIKDIAKDKEQLWGRSEKVNM